MNTQFKIQNSKFKINAFTLIEMLTVIAIIAILTGILYPALRTIRDGPKKALARADIRRIEMAVQAYYNEYGRWPPPTNVTEEFYSMLNGNLKPYDGSAVAGGYYLNNSRKTRFLSLERKNVNQWNEFLDPWGKPYWVCIDNGGGGFGCAAVVNNWGDYSNWNGGFMPPDDGLIRQRGSLDYTLKRSIAVYSWGPNKTEDDAKGPEYDDIASWY